MKGNGKRTYDLEERLIQFAASVIDVVQGLTTSPAGVHVAKQLMRSGTSPAANYGEAQAAESRRDFVHKMRISLKELQETRVWLRLVAMKSLCKSEDSANPALLECEELIRIFAKSISTAGTRRTRETKQAADG